MNQPTTQSANPGPWLLIIGLLLGAGLLIFMTYDGMSRTKGQGRHSEHVVAVTEASWEQEVLDSKVPVVVDFSAVWCGPCQMFAPTLDAVAERYRGKVKVCQVDVGNNSFDKVPHLRQQYEIEGIPLVLIFKGGELRKAFRRGGPTEHELSRAIDSVLN